MRRCKYLKNDLGFFICYKGDTLCFCPVGLMIPQCYEPVELDPYWKDIFDETNRRLYDR